MRLTLFISVVIFCTVSEAKRKLLRSKLRGDDFRADVGDRLPSEVITNYGYPWEGYSIQTDDGYILSLDRIPYGRECGPDRPRKPNPVILTHGIYFSSHGFILQGPRKSWGFILADNCYDVWMPNTRGNLYSRNHFLLDPDRNMEFWDYSAHEKGIYDLPAIINFTLSVTYAKKVYYIGHSQGSTAFFIYSSLLPEQAYEKVKAAFAIAPVAYMKHVKIKQLRLLAPYHVLVENFIHAIGLYEFPIDGLGLLSRTVCSNKAFLTQWICYAVISVSGGISDQLNKTMIPNLLYRFPSGGSTKEALHYLQWMSYKGGFRHYDYGSTRNMYLYGSSIPPSYPLSNIRVPIGLYYSKNDVFATNEDVYTLRFRLPYVIESYEVPHDKFNHMDFLCAKDGPVLLYFHMISVMDHF